MMEAYTWVAPDPLLLIICTSSLNCLYFVSCL